MKKFKAAKNVIEEYTICKFAARRGSSYRELIIKDGEITKIFYTMPSCCENLKKGDPEFILICKITIRFIVDQKPAELKNIYHALADGPMKDYCKELQQIKIAELEF